MVARQVLIMTGIGIAIGGALALAAGGVLAAAFPASRAARLDPVSALRAD
jgi:ABC-type antimicrobial peptide transport system permease subunit